MDINDIYKIEVGDILLTTSETKQLVIKGVKNGVIQNTSENLLYTPKHAPFSLQQSGIKDDYITVFDGKFVNRKSLSEVLKLTSLIIKASDEVKKHFSQLN